MKRVLLVLVHPAFERSRVNRRLFEAACAVPGVTAHDLYERYPDFSIDVKSEQALCEAHDAIVFQHPFYWYSAPALLKEWQDAVLELGWAYGRGGRALAGKITFHAITTGGQAAAYREGGRNRFTMRQLLAPFDQSAHLCGMRFLAPLVVHGTPSLATDDDVRPHARRYARVLEAIRDDRLDLERAAQAVDLAELDEREPTRAET